MAEAAKKHSKISSSINELVVDPFSRWCDSHENRVLSCHEDLQNRIRVHDRQAELVRKLRSAYFNKCRQVEDMEEESKLASEISDGGVDGQHFDQPLITSAETIQQVSHHAAERCKTEQHTLNG